MLSAMRTLIPILIGLLVVGCGGKKDDGNTGVVNPNKPSPKVVPDKLIAGLIVEKVLRKQLKKPSGELTKADLANVNMLNLDLSKITDEGLKELAKLQELKYLSLVTTGITDEGLKEVAKLQNLNTLNLNGCEQITDMGLKELGKLKKLEWLYLYGPKVTKVGTDELMKVLPNCSIDPIPTK